MILNCTGKFCYRQGNFHNTEAATGSVLKIQIKVSQNSRENTYAGVSFLKMLQGLGQQLYLITDSEAGVFLSILLNF